LWFFGDKTGSFWFFVKEAHKKAVFTFLEYEFFHHGLHGITQMGHRFNSVLIHNFRGAEVDFSSD